MSLTPTSPGGAVLDPLSVLRSCGVRAGMRVADFGCGHGHFTIPSAELVGARGSVFAIDLQHELVKSLESHTKSLGLINVEPIWADLEAPGSLKIPSDILDVVLLVSNHVNGASQLAMMREAHRTLKKGGVVLLIEWLEGSTVPFAPAISERVARDVSIANADRAGFRVVDEFRPGRYHYGLRLQKS